MRVLLTLIILAFSISAISQTDSLKPVASSIWDTLIPLLIGAGLTLGAQFFIELWKSNKDKGKKRQELISMGRGKIYLIAQLLKHLAMYKTHKQYYYRAYEVNGDDDSFKKHYEKGQEQRIIESTLANSIAEYFQIVTEYRVLTNNKDNFEQLFERIFNYTHPKPSKFADCNTSVELIAGLGKEEARLNTEYKNLYAIFEAVQASMK